MQQNQRVHSVALGVANCPRCIRIANWDAAFAQSFQDAPALVFSLPARVLAAGRRKTTLLERGSWEPPSTTTLSSSFAAACS